jgi:hypothetical protein
MAEQTRTQRQAAGKRAAATRRQSESRQRAAAARRSARSGTRAAGAVSKDAQGTATQTTCAVARGFGAGALRVNAVGRQLERALLIEVGAALDARDALRSTVRKFSTRRKITTRLRRWERRGETALRRSRRRVTRDVNHARRDLDRQTRDLRTDAGSVVTRLRPTG